MRAKACSFAAGAALASAAWAQAFVNGDFETYDFTGWTVVNTANGAGAPGQVLTADIDGPGPLGPSLAASFRAGQAVAMPGVQEGVELTQTLVLEAGRRYTVELGWTVISLSGSYADGAVYSIIVDGGIVASQAVPFVSQQSAPFGRLVGVFTPVTSGTHVVGVRVTRPWPVGTFLRQFVDNVRISAGPACYANCDGSTSAPVLSVNDFVCFQSAFAAGDPYANCDGSTAAPTLSVNDFVCFQAAFAAGCR